MSRAMFLRLGTKAAFVAMLFLGVQCHKSPTEAEVATIQIVWANGSAGAWGGDAVLGSIKMVSQVPLLVSVETVDVTDDVTGGRPSLRVNNIDTVGQTIGFGEIQAYLNNAKDASAYQNGHVRFDIRLEPAFAAKLSAIEFGSTLPQNTGVQLSVSSLSSTKFTHVDIPLANLSMYPTYNGVRTLFYLSFAYTSRSVPLGGIMTLNDIKWTSD